jgi:hypothetical protein
MPDSALVLAEFQLTDGFGRAMSVSPDGEVRLPLGTWGHVATDGTVTNANRRARGRLQANGNLVDANGLVIATIDADATAHIDNREFRFNDNGKLVGSDGAPDITLSPPDSPARRTAMLVVLLSLLRPAPEDAQLVPRVRLTPNLQHVEKPMHNSSPGPSPGPGEDL